MQTNNNADLTQGQEDRVDCSRRCGMLLNQEACSDGMNQVNQVQKRICADFFVKMDRTYIRLNQKDRS